MAGGHIMVKHRNFPRRGQLLWVMGKGGGLLALISLSPSLFHLFLIFTFTSRGKGHAGLHRIAFNL